MSKNQEPDKANPKHSQQINGGCHCQAVRFEAVVDDNTVVLNCNCSICRMTGFKHLIVKHTDFILLQGEQNLTTYQFNTGQAKHLFCQHCGVKSFYQPRSHPDSWSVNTRCIDDFESSDWTHEKFNGQSWQQAKAKLEQNTHD